MASTIQEDLLDEFRSIAPAAEARTEAGALDIGGAGEATTPLEEFQTIAAAAEPRSSAPVLDGGDAGEATTPLEEFQAIAAATEPQSPAGALDGGGATASGAASGVTSGTATSESVAASSRAVSANSGESSAGSIAMTILESGLGLIPLAGELAGLFGGSDQPEPLEKYAMPTPISFEGVDTGSGMSAADFDQLGMPRTDAVGVGAADPADSDDAEAAAGGVTSGAAGPQITVSVQAMDARSFLDRSSDIAQAVRAAMLNMNSINDVVNEL